VQVCTANFSTPAVCISTLHTVAVKANTAASETKFSKRCNPCADRERQVEILITRHAMYVWRNIEALSYTIVALEKQLVVQNPSVCICSLRYPACNVHAAYCHLWPVRMCNILSPYFINGMIFEKRKVIESKVCVLIFSTRFVLNISHSKKKRARYY